jgi:hypothetical protein
MFVMLILASNFLKVFAVTQIMMSILMVMEGALLVVQLLLDVPNVLSMVELHNVQDVILQVDSRFLERFVVTQIMMNILTVMEDVILV